MNSRILATGPIVILGACVFVAVRYTSSMPSTPAPPGGETHDERSTDVVLEYDGYMRVYHDRARGVTCWVLPQAGYAGGGVSCLSDRDVSRDAGLE